MSDRLLARLRAAAPSVFADRPVLFAYLFGSRAEGRPRSDSDVDVAVYLHPPEDPLEASLELAGALADASGLGGIEVVTLNDAPLDLVGRIIRGRRVIYSRDEAARVRFESQMLRRYLDFRIHADPLERALLRATARGRR